MSKRLACPECGGVEFYEVRHGYTLHDAAWWEGDNYARLGELLKEDTEALWFECQACSLVINREADLVPAGQGGLVSPLALLAPSEHCYAEHDVFCDCLLCQLEDVLEEGER